MKIRLTNAREGVNKSYLAGEEYDFPDEEAKRLIAAGEATPAGSSKKVVETTVNKSNTETASKPAPVKRAPAKAAPKQAEEKAEPETTSEAE